MTRLLCILLISALPVAASVQAQGPGDLPKVRDGLIAVAAADSIRQQCSMIEPRLVRAYSFIKSLESYARSQGFSRSQVSAFVDDKAQKRALETRAQLYLAQNGVDPAVPATYCTVGRAEIAANSAIGRLLRAK